MPNDFAPAPVAGTPAGDAAGVKPAETAPKSTPNTAQKGGDSGANLKPKDPTPPARKPDEDLHEFTVDGKKVRVTLAELKRRYSVEEASQKRFQDASQLSKKAETVLSKLRDAKSAIAFLNDKELGLNPEEIRAEFEAWYHKTVIEREAMSPAERRAADAEAKLKEIEDAKAAEEKETQTRAEQEAEKRMAHTVQQELIEILNTSSLPKTRFTVSRLAHWIAVNENNGINASHEVLVAQVRKETQDIARSIISSADGEMLEALFGKEGIDKIRKHDLTQLRARRGQVGQPAEPQAPKYQSTKPGQPRQKLRGFEVNNRLRAMRLGRK